LLSFFHALGYFRHIALSKDILKTGVRSPGSVFTYSFWGIAVPCYKSLVIGQSVQRTNDQ